MRHIKAPVRVARKVTAERLLWQIIDADKAITAAVERLDKARREK